MKPYVLSPGARSIALRAAVGAFCWSLVTGSAFAENILIQGIDTLYDLRDQNQANAFKSVKGVKDAMQEGPKPDPEGKPWTLQDLQQIQQKNQKLYDNASALAKSQQNLLEIDRKILEQLPSGDPRRQVIEDEMKKVGQGLPETRNKIGEWGNALNEANKAVDTWKQKEDPTYSPPPRPPIKTKTTPPPKTDDTESSGPSGPTGPTGPTGPVGSGPNTGGGGPSGPAGPVTTGGGNIDAWKAKEAELENKARNLGKEREQAVIDYLNDPTPENKEKAAAIKQKLDGLVNKLNKVRGKVDGLTGGSRSPLKVKTAKQIKNKWKQGGMTAGGGGEGHHHGADGQDIPNKYVSGGGSGGKTKSGGGGKRRKAGVASSSSSSGHSHGPGGVDIPNNQARGQGGGNRQGKKRRMAAAQQTQQTNTANSNLATNQNQVQNPNQQRRKKKQRGY